MEGGNVSRVFSDVKPVGGPKTDSWTGKGSSITHRPLFLGPRGSVLPTATCITCGIARLNRSIQEAQLNLNLRYTVSHCECKFAPNCV